MHVQPYLFFNGRCEEAFEFYRRALGAEWTMRMRFKDHPDPQEHSKMTPGSEDKIMHMQFRVGDTVVMASDGHCQGAPNFEGFALTLIAPDEAEAERLFNAWPMAGSAGAARQDVLFSMLRHGR